MIKGIISTILGIIILYLLYGSYHTWLEGSNGKAYKKKIIVTEYTTNERCYGTGIDCVSFHYTEREADLRPPVVVPDTVKLNTSN